ncbi:hypothetical protein [Candidatus Vondammii sp. HM_W22]|uniref:hypothetical protein n=1 Tax=Candidatus Vondammii sp. HM_W22 TaxID=2687299 RepID=UPI001F139A1D|nr:hypothetical protein [Candidatus Vondammii sp. HM_W22]
MNNSSMTLEQFLKTVGADVIDLSEISKENALAVVQEDGYALQFMKKCAFE